MCSIYCSGKERRHSDARKHPKDLFPENVLPCSDETGENYLGGDFVFIKDVPYFGHLVGDLYLPSEGGEFPIAIHIHGGGWVAGSRRTPMARWWGEFLACNGVAVFDVDYTLIPKAVDVIQQVKEIRCAILWTQTEGKEKFGIGDKIVVFGGSAGGHLTALSALKEDVDLSGCPWLRNVKSFPKISAAIPFYGIYDFTIPPFPTVVRDRGLVRSGEDPAKISPIFYVENAHFPFLIIHGTSDYIPLYQPVNFHKKLISKGKISELFIIDNASHAFDVFPETEYTRKAKEKIYTFLLDLGIIKPHQVKRKPTPHNHIDKGRRFLEEGHYKHAYLEFFQEKVSSCQTEYGKFLSIAFYIIENLINAQDTGLISLVPSKELSISASSPFLAREERLKHAEAYDEYSEILRKKPDFNSYYENYIVPVLDKISLMEDLLSYIINNSCKFETQDGILLYLSGFNVRVRIGKTFGEEFPLLVVSLGKFAKAILYLIFSHDIYLEVNEKVLELFERSILNPSDRIGFFRDLGSIYVDNPDILKFKRPHLWDRAKSELIGSLMYFAEFLSRAFLDTSDVSDVFSIKDADGSGNLSVADVFSTGVIEVEPKNSSHWYLNFLNLLQFLPMLGEDYFEGLLSFTRRLAEKIEENSFVNLSEFDVIVPDILGGTIKKHTGEKIFPEFISVNVGRFLDAKRPFREFLPEVVMFDSSYIFLIENEMGRKWEAKDVFPEKNCYYCPPGERFKAYDKLISFDGKQINYLPDDGIALEGKFIIQNIGIVYLYYKEPTFADSVLVLVSDSFVKPDVFLMNEAVAKVAVRIEKILESLRRR